MELQESIQNKVVLDIGCGDGRYVLRLLRHHPKWAIGLDVDLPRLKGARNLQPTYEDPPGDARVQFVNGDGNFLPFKDESIDYITCSVTLYLLDQQQVLSEIQRVLRPGGYFTFTDATAWYAVRRIFTSNGQPPSSSRFRSICGMLFILFNGILYNTFRIPPFLRKFTKKMWYIYQDEKRLMVDFVKHGLVVIKQKTLSEWKGRPVLFLWTVRKPPRPDAKVRSRKRRITMEVPDNKGGTVELSLICCFNRLVHWVEAKMNALPDIQNHFFTPEVVPYAQTAIQVFETL